MLALMFHYWQFGRVFLGRTHILFLGSLNALMHEMHEMREMREMPFPLDFCFLVRAATSHPRAQSPAPHASRDPHATVRPVR